MKYHVSINNIMKEVEAPNIIEAIHVALKTHFSDFEKFYYLDLKIWASGKED